jgi:hypothetical protein
VRTTEVHGACRHGAVPSTNPSRAETNVTDAARNPAGTGPPDGWTMPAGAATGAVAACAAVTEDRGDAGGAGAPPQAARIAAASSPPHAVANDFINLT